MFVKFFIVLAGTLIFSSFFGGELSEEHKDSVQEFLSETKPEEEQSENKAVKPKKAQPAILGFIPDQKPVSNDELCLEDDPNPYDMIESLCEKYSATSAAYLLLKDMSFNESDLAEARQIMYGLMHGQYQGQPDLFQSSFFISELSDNEEKVLHQLGWSIVSILEWIQSTDFAERFSFLSEKDFSLGPACSRFQKSPEEWERLVLLEYQFESVKRIVDREISFRMDDLIKDVNSFLKDNKDFESLPVDIRGGIIPDIFSLYMDNLNIKGHNDVEEEIKLFNEIFGVSFPDTSEAEIQDTVVQVMEDTTNNIFEDVREVIRLIQNGSSHEEVAQYMGLEDSIEYDDNVKSAGGKEYDKTLVFEEVYSSSFDSAGRNRVCEQPISAMEYNNFKRFVSSISKINQRLDNFINLLNLKRNSAVESWVRLPYTKYPDTGNNMIVPVVPEEGVDYHLTWSVILELLGEEPGPPLLK